MVSKSPKDRVVPLPNGLNGLQIGVTNYLLTGMILQVGSWQRFFTSPSVLDKNWATKIAEISPRISGTENGGFLLYLIFGCFGGWDVSNP